jgi:hypothetical protein
MDIIYLAGIFILFGVTAALAIGCDRLGGKK